MLQIREEVGFTKGRIIVRGKLVTRGQAKRADYILYYKPNIPLALIEAKDNYHSVGDGMQQALGYAITLDIPFVFSSNGDGFLFHDRTGLGATSETTLALDAFPSPSDLWARYAKWKGLDAAAEILRHGALMMADHHRRADIATDLQGFLNRQQNVVCLVPHMRDVNPANAAQSLCNGDDLIRRRQHIGRIVQPDRKARSPLRQRVPQPGLHMLRLPVCRGTLSVPAHRLDPQRHVADQRIGIHRGRFARQALGIFAKTVEREPAFVTQQIQRGYRPGRHPHRRQ